MPPKQKFERADIIKAAYEIVREKGLEELSARKIAERMKSSVAPIYSHFKSIDELQRISLKLARELLYRYVASTSTHRTFLNLLLGLVRFAERERPLYQALFLNRKTREFTEEFKNVMRLEMYKDTKFANTPDYNREVLFERLWVSVYGLATSSFIEFNKERDVQDLIHTLEKIELAVMVSEHR